MEDSSYRKVRREAIRQGWRVEPIRSGEMFFSPDGVHMATWHSTPSARNALNRFVGELRRGGFVWPPPRR